MPQAEVDIIRLAQTGNSDAFGHLYQMHIDAITRFIQRKIGEVDEVENLTQIVFMKAWQAIARYRPEQAPFRAWLYRIAGNTVIDHFRTRKDVDDIDAHRWLPDEGALPDERLLAGERSEAVHRAVDSLRPNYRQVISLRFLEEYDYAETAHTLSREVNAVRVTQFRALGALKKALSREPVLWLATLATAFSLVLGGTITVAADRSLPGDRLYGVKQSMEDVRLARTNEAGHVELYLNFADRRLDEAGRLLATGRTDDLMMAVSSYNQEVNRGLVSLTALVYSESDSELTALAASRLAQQQTRLAEIGDAGNERTQMPLEQAQLATEQAIGEVELLRKAPPPPTQDHKPQTNDAQSSAPPVRHEQPVHEADHPPASNPADSDPGAGDANEPSAEVSLAVPPSDAHQQPATGEAPAPNPAQGVNDQPEPRVASEAPVPPADAASDHDEQRPQDHEHQSDREPDINENPDATQRPPKEEAHAQERATPPREGDGERGNPDRPKETEPHADADEEDRPDDDHDRGEDDPERSRGDQSDKDERRAQRDNPPDKKDDPDNQPHRP